MEFLHDELLNAFLKLVNIKHANIYILDHLSTRIQMEARFITPMRWLMKLYICIGVIVTKKISLYDGKHAKLHFSPTSGKHLKKQLNLSVWMRFSWKISRNREIHDKTADDLNILICHLPKKKDGSAYEPTALASFACCLHSREKNKNVIHQPRSVVIGSNRETMPVVFSTQNHRHSFFQYGPPSLWITYTVYSRPNLNEILFTLRQEWLLKLCQKEKTLVQS